MEEKSVPFYVHEADMTRMERSNHRLWILCIILTLILVITNCGWIWYESQWEVYEETTQEVTQDARDGGTNRFVGGDYYGETDSQNND